MNLTEATINALQGKKISESFDGVDFTDIEKEILNATQEILKKHGIRSEKYTNLEMSDAIKFQLDGSTYVVLVDELDMIDEGKSRKTEDKSDNYRVVEIVDASEPDVHYRYIMLNYKHKVQDFQDEMWNARKRHEKEIDEYGNDLEVVLDDIDPSFDWYEVDGDDDKLII